MLNYEVKREPIFSIGDSVRMHKAAKEHFNAPRWVMDGVADVTGNVVSIGDNGRGVHVYTLDVTRKQNNDKPYKIAESYLELAS